MITITNVTSVSRQAITNAFGTQRALQRATASTTRASALACDGTAGLDGAEYVTGGSFSRDSFESGAISAHSSSHSDRCPATLSRCVGFGPAVVGVESVYNLFPVINKIVE